MIAGCSAFGRKDSSLLAVSYSFLTLLLPKTIVIPSILIEGSAIAVNTASPSLSSEDPWVRSSAAVAIGEYGSKEFTENAIHSLRTIIFSNIKDKKFLYFCVSSLMLYLSQDINHLDEYKKILSQYIELIVQEEQRFMSVVWPGKRLGFFVKMVNINPDLAVTISTILRENYFDKKELAIPILFALISFAKAPLTDDAAVQEILTIILDMLSINNVDQLKQAFIVISKNRLIIVELLESLLNNNNFLTDFSTYIDNMMANVYTIDNEIVIDKLVILFTRLLHENKLKNDAHSS
jgi:hypothetical protein